MGEEREKDPLPVLVEKEDVASGFSYTEAFAWQELWAPPVEMALLVVKKELFSRFEKVTDCQDNLLAKILYLTAAEETNLKAETRIAKYITHIKCHREALRAERAKDNPELAKHPVKLPTREKAIALMEKWCMNAAKMRTFFSSARDQTVLALCELFIEASDALHELHNRAIGITMSPPLQAREDLENWLRSTLRNKDDSESGTFEQVMDLVTRESPTRRFFDDPQLVVPIWCLIDVVFFILSNAKNGDLTEKTRGAILGDWTAAARFYQYMLQGVIPLLHGADADEQFIGKSGNACVDIWNLAKNKNYAHELSSFGAVLEGAFDVSRCQTQTILMYKKLSKMIYPVDE